MAYSAKQTRAAYALGNIEVPLTGLLVAALMSALYTPQRCFSDVKSPPCDMILRDITTNCGIEFIHTDGSSGQRYIVETVCCGLASFDYDSDGDIDIYFLNGAPQNGAKVGTPPMNRLYRNEGDWQFTDVTQQSGAGDKGYGLGVCTGDYDNDGDADIYISNYGPNVMYRNNGDGTFSDVTRQAGVDNGSRFGAGVSFLDADGDGDLDLYVSNYVDFTYDKHQVTRRNGFPTYVGPLNYQPAPDALYRNNGDGTFTDVSTPAGIDSKRGNGMGMICTDYDSDGDTDIFVGNDGLANFFFQNDGSGRFREIGVWTGLAYDLQGIGQGNMGVECADLDNDGKLDFHTTTYQRQLATHYKNLRGQLFDDATRRTRAGTGTYSKVTWGNGLIDFDNDGDRDIFMACGHLLDNVESFDDSTSYRSRNVVLMNSGNEFFDVSDRCGDGLMVKLSSRGAAFDDLDNDGDVDVVILNARSRPTILRNDSKSENHWLQVALRGTQTNRDGIGAQVKVVSKSLALIDEIHSGRSYQSDFGKRLHFGLGKNTRVDRIEVRWIGGKTEVFKDVILDRLVTLTEGTGVEMNTR